MGIGCFYVLVEGVGGGHVAECGRGGRVYGPAFGQDYDLGELAAGGEVVGAEGVVGVAGDGPVAVEVAHRLVEIVGGLDVREAHSARRRG